MRRGQRALFAFVAALAACLTVTAAAQAATVTIDAVDTGGPSRWEPPTVTIDAGDTVRWEFDEAATTHTLKSSSPNWSMDALRGPGGEAIEHTFTEPGTYTFLCDLHPTTMTGAVTVEDGPADPLQNVLVFSKTAGFRHGEAITAGTAAIQELGGAHGFEVDATEDAAQFTDANLAQYDAIVFLNTTGDVLDNAQQAAFERYIQAGGGYVGIHSAADTEYGWSWYGEMLGGYFRNHPPGTPTASIDVEDTDEPSTQGVPARWTRTDEWYNYRSPTSATGGPDYSPRDSGVKVLATLDESTYVEDDGNATDDDHPIAWCTDFDGGRAWYTGFGHTPGTFSEPEFRSHLLGGIRTAARAAQADCGEPRQATPTANDFEKITLDDDTENPFELDVAPDGRVFYIERNGEVNIWKPDTEQTVVAGNIPVYTGEENGLMGLQLAPDFETSGWIYLTYSALPESTNQQRVSRFKVVGDQLDMASEQIILTWQHQRDQCCHSAGALYFGPDGSLFVSTGDNTNPFDSNGFTPIDERPGRAAWDAQRTAANTNDLNGKILRIMPMDTPTGPPGVGTTYTIPPGNLFPAGAASTRPEIYGMGFRNPFRFTVDPETGWVLMGDYGPDAPQTNPNRGPQGSVEFNVVDEPGNYGWPYCIRQNAAYNDYNFENATPGPKFDCANPVNESPNNTGLTQLPPAIPADAWLGYTETDSRFPELGTGGAPMGGPRYHFDPDNPSPTKFPEIYDGQWFIAEWNNDWIKTATLDGEGSITDINSFPSLGTGPRGYRRPMDLDFGPDGSLYLIEWGTGFGGNNADSGLYRIDYIKGNRRPIAHASATPDSGPTPLEVTFSSEGSIDPEGSSLTYHWDFGDGSTSTDPNPTHTYTANGTYTAQLTVTDQDGMTGTDNIEIIAGNTRPEVTIEFPEVGQFADFGELVPYKISVTDAEDGSTANGTISCDDVTLNVILGHNDHPHKLDDMTGCEGTFETLTESSHGPNENIFPVVEAVYRDKGGPGGAGPITGNAVHQLQPKRKQAEHFTTTGRTADARGGGDPGVQTETTGDTEGGGQNIGFIEDGDYVSYAPMNLKDIDGLRFRWASAGAGGTIEVRLDAPDGQLVAQTETIAPTGGWQVYKNVDLALTDPPEGTHQLFFVFRHPTSTGGLMNLNWIDFRGKGAAVSQRPEVSAAANPATGEAPLEVAFDGTASDPDGEALTYRWDFGVPGTDEDTSTELDPTYTYENPGTYNATFTATDPHGAKATASVQVRVTGGGQCPTGTRSDEFEGNALDTSRWTVIRPDNTHPFSVANGQLALPIDNGSIYGPGTSARNIIVQPLPSGEVSVTAKITAEQLTENYHQAGLRVYSDDDNWASVHMISAGGQRDIEFIYESNGNPRNEAADKLGGLPAQAPTTYYVRIISDGEQLTAEYSFDGEEFLPVGRPGSLSTFTNPRIGPVALSDAAPSVPTAYFDWIRFDPDEGGGGPGGGGPSRDDQFEGTSLDKERWNAIVRENPDSYTVGNGQLTITTEPGDIYGGDTNPPPNNFILQSADHAGDDWVIETKIDSRVDGGYGQGGLLAYQDGNNYVKLDPIADAGQTRINRIELRTEVAGTPSAPGTADPQVPEGSGTIFWLRLTKQGTTYTGEYSRDGVSWSPAGTVENPMADPAFGIYAFGPQEAGVGDTVSFDSFTLDGSDVLCPCADAADEFDGSALDKTRWNEIVREDESLYTVQDGALRVTTVNGDIYAGGDPASTRNFFLQSADHAGADWTIETKVDAGGLSDGYEQAGLLAYLDDGDYVKYDVLSDAGQTVLNRIELRSEENDVIQNPQPQVTPLPAGTTTVWLRLTKAGDMYSGQYSFDGTSWTALPEPVQNDMAAPRFGLFTLGVNSGGGTAVFDYFAVDGSTGCPDPGNNPPAITAAAADPTTGFAPLEVSFTAEATDSDGDELSYSWDFDGDGTQDSTQQNPTHTYTEPGEYAAKVTVSDGNEGTATRTVPVNALEPDDPNARFRALVFSKTTGFRHDSIDEGHAALESLGVLHDFQVDHTEDATAFRDEILEHYDTVVFLSTTGDPLNDAQQAAFERYIRGGGGYTGIHAAADTEYEWTWYGRLVGGYFLSHPPGTPTASIDVEDQDDHTTRGLPARWTRRTSGTTTSRRTSPTRTSRTATTARARAASTSC